jgi:hypothetical protein
MPVKKSKLNSKTNAAKGREKKQEEEIRRNLEQGHRWPVPIVATAAIVSPLRDSVAPVPFDHAAHSRILVMAMLASDSIAPSRKILVAQ